MEKAKKATIKMNGFNMELEVIDSTHVSMKAEIDRNGRKVPHHVREYLGIYGTLYSDMLNWIAGKFEIEGREYTR